MTRKRVSDETYEILSANIESRVVSPSLWKRIRENKPDIVVVQQAYRARAFLKRIPGYKVFHHPDRAGGEWNEIAILVRDNVDVAGVKWLQMKQPWIGGKAGKRHEPRVYPAVRVRKGDSDDLYVLGVHLPTFNAKTAQAESFKEIAEYINAHDKATVVAVGDWNNEAKNVHIVDDVKGSFHSTGKVDGALVARAKRQNGRRVQFPHYAHGWGLHTITVPNK